METTIATIVAITTTTVAASNTTNNRVVTVIIKVKVVGIVLINDNNNNNNSWICRLQSARNSVSGRGRCDQVTSENQTQRCFLTTHFIGKRKCIWMNQEDINIRQAVFVFFVLFLINFFIHWAKKHACKAICILTQEDINIRQAVSVFNLFNWLGDDACMQSCLYSDLLHA